MAGERLDPRDKSRRWATDPARGSEREGGRVRTRREEARPPRCCANQQFLHASMMRGQMSRQS